MNRQNINQNVDNNSFKDTISTISVISISNSQELTDYTNHSQDNNSNGAVQENSEIGDFMRSNNNSLIITRMWKEMKMKELTTLILAKLIVTKLIKIILRKLYSRFVAYLMLD